MGQIMNQHLAVYRDEAGMQEALDKIRQLQAESEEAWTDDKGKVFNQDLLAVVELSYMLDCAEAICLASLHRKESRGAHTRMDFTERDDQNWMKHILVSKNGAPEPELSYSAVSITQWQPEVRSY